MPVFDCVGCNLSMMFGWLYLNEKRTQYLKQNSSPFTNPWFYTTWDLTQIYTTTLSFSNEIKYDSKEVIRMQIWLYATDRALVSFCVIVTTFKTFKFINPRLWRHFHACDRCVGEWESGGTDCLVNKLNLPRYSSRFKNVTKPQSWIPYAFSRYD